MTNSLRMSDSSRGLSCVATAPGVNKESGYVFLGSRTGLVGKLLATAGSYWFAKHLSERDGTESNLKGRKYTRMSQVTNYSNLTWWLCRYVGAFSGFGLNRNYYK